MLLEPRPKRKLKGKIGHDFRKEKAIILCCKYIHQVHIYQVHFMRKEQFKHVY